MGFLKAAIKIFKYVICNSPKWHLREMQVIFMVNNSSNIFYTDFAFN